ncbi:oligosaccharide flippase family protein [Bradyrhizobium rifense]|uniref:Oligosaccharide flippase family protein n=1 Tax=Bradyrhizobium rifense TaxID=515499 RepID=A0A5D3KKA8_9BRAD|nr:oligosaccharide flippase family protein [Bradyrhizobium rifense]TYL92015.1 oligosaccharide flippase family protein [Bradyrhizobium rifense]
MGVRRALFWATIGRNLVMLINLAVAIIVGRLIGPSAFGVSVLGGSALIVAEALREIGGGAYLIQEKELTARQIRTSITASVLISIAISVLLYSSAGPIADFYNLPEVGHYIRIAALGYLLGPFIFPVFALMSREMAFGSFAFVNASMAVVGGLTSFWLAKLGFGYISLAWATVAASVAGSVLCFLLRSDRSIYLPSLSEWRSVIGFGAFDGATALVAAIGEYAPYIVIGRVLDAANVGIAQRAVLLAAFPERVILAGVGATALPVFSRSVREKSDTGAVYLNVLELISAVHWPCLLLLGTVSTPLVGIVLGPQWIEVAPLVRILCLAAAFSFPLALQYPVLVAVGAVRSLPPLVAGQVILNTAVTAFAASHGLFSIAWCLVGIIPLNALIAVAVVRRYLDFCWSDFFGALRKSVVLTIFSGSFPIWVVLTRGHLGDVSIETGLLGVLLSIVGWGIGLLVTRHPLRLELVRAAKIIKENVDAWVH